MAGAASLDGEPTVQSAEMSVLQPRLEGLNPTDRVVLRRHGLIGIPSSGAAPRAVRGRASRRQSRYSRYHPRHAPAVPIGLWVQDDRAAIPGGNVNSIRIRVGDAHKRTFKTCHCGLAELAARHSLPPRENFVRMLRRPGGESRRGKMATTGSVRWLRNQTLSGLKGQPDFATKEGGFGRWHV